MITTLIWLLVLLVVLALVVWAMRAVLSGLGAPAWLFQVLAAVACIIALLAVVQTLMGGPIPGLR